MMLVHHNTGEWVRSNDWTSASRTEGFVHTYASLDEVNNQWLRDQFTWMLETGEYVISSGSDVLQVRR